MAPAEGGRLLRGSLGGGKGGKLAQKGKFVKIEVFGSRHSKFPDIALTKKRLTLRSWRGHSSPTIYEERERKKQVGEREKGAGKGRRERDRERKKRKGQGKEEEKGEG